MVDWQIYGNHPGGHHITNVILHTMNAILVFLLLMYMTGFMWRSAFVAALFALHPIHVESVAWVSERKDVLSTLFWLCTTLLYVWYTRKPSLIKMVAVAGAFAVGLMAKPMLVTLPCTLLLLDFWPLNRLKTTPGISAVKKWTVLLLEKWPLFLLVVASSVVTFIAQRAGGAVTKLDALPIPVRLANAAMSYIRYILKMLWPDPLSPYYYHEFKHINYMVAGGAALVLIAITILFWKLRTKKPYCITGWLWYLGTLIPVIGIVQVGIQAMAERYTYVPLLGIFIIMVWLYNDTVRKLPSKTVVSAITAVVLVIAMVAKTTAQVGYWKNTVTLFSHAVDVDPRGEFPNLTLGAAYMRQNDLKTAHEYFCNALSYNPYGSLTLAYDAFCLMQMGNIAEAGVHLQRAMRVTPNDKDVLVNMAYYCINSGKPQDALAYCDRVSAIAPDLITADYYRADALQALGRFDEAVLVYRNIAVKQPDDADAFNNIGMVYGKQGRREEALTAFRQSLTIKPDQAQAHSNMGRVLMELNRVPEAVQEFSKALEYDKNNIAALNNLGVALFQQGNYAAAAAEFSDALRINPNYRDAAVNLQLAQSKMK
jgi:tetratricopeptide (TPR) repeat protein